MKRILTTILSLFFVASISAQKDVTKFMGIPVDGFKPEMIQKLKAKGFTVGKGTDLNGEFNGKEVNISVQTNNNKVWRICVSDAKPTDETNIKINFNHLYEQFAANDKYMCFNDYTIPQDEDISYEMLVNKKRYDAIFIQKPTDAEQEKRMEVVTSLLRDKYSDEEIANMGEDVRKDMVKHLSQMQSKRLVWFTIGEVYNQYYITIFYENGYNEANGEDL